MMIEPMQKFQGDQTKQTETKILKSDKLIFLAEGRHGEGLLTEEVPTEEASMATGKVNSMDNQIDNSEAEEMAEEGGEEMEEGEAEGQVEGQAECCLHRVL